MSLNQTAGFYAGCRGGPAAGGGAVHGGSAGGGAPPRRAHACARHSDSAGPTLRCQSCQDARNKQLSVGRPGCVHAADCMRGMCPAPPVPGSVHILQAKQWGRGCNVKSSICCAVLRALVSGVTGETCLFPVLLQPRKKVGRLCTKPWGSSNLRSLQEHSWRARLWARLFVTSKAGHIRLIYIFGTIALGQHAAVTSASAAHTS